LQAHLTVDDQPVAIRLATWDELRQLVHVMTRKNAGIFEIANEQHPDHDRYDDYLRDLSELAIESGRLFTFTLSFAKNDPYFGQRRLELCSDVVAAGGRMVGQVHSREFLSVLGFKVNLPFDRLPGWRTFRAQPLDAQRAGLLDPEYRARLVREATEGPYQSGTGAEARPPDYDVMRIYDAADGRPCRTVAEVARENDMNPVDVIIDYSLRTNFDGLFAQMLTNEDPGTVLNALKDPNTVIAVSDTGAHVTQIIDSSNPTYVLGHWVRGREQLTWEQGVRMLSADPAAVWGLDDRGFVREGYTADLVVFDPETIAPALPTVDQDLPGGGTRLKQRAVGVHATVVNGEVTLRDGEHTGALPGRLIRHRPDKTAGA
jgi:N-acyl-D-aspartate/D-glutamate deacylase